MALGLVDLQTVAVEGTAVQLPLAAIPIAIVCWIVVWDVDVKVEVAL